MKIKNSGKIIAAVSPTIIAVMAALYTPVASAQIPLGPGPVESISPPPSNPDVPPPPPGSQPSPPPPPNTFGNPPGANPTPPGWGAPGTLQNPPTADWMNQGTLNVMATGYDSQGVLKQIPLYVSYTWNGVNYNVIVLNSWNPYTQMWNTGVDQPAYSTSYYFNGFNYNFYAPLSIGTFYFNL